MKKALYILLVLVLAAIAGVCLFLPGDTERRMNAVQDPPPYEASNEARALHARLLVADMHADSLLWGRDLNLRGTGSDYDGAIKAPFDTSGVVLVTQALLKEGFSEADTALIMGNNYLRLLARTLP